jgi:peptide/nickel transport system ATP-binding protein
VSSRLDERRARASGGPQAGGSAAADDAIVSVRGLSVAFDGREGLARVVDDVSFAVGRGETVCLVGESGCGKSVTARALLGIVPAPGRIVAGAVRLEGRDLRTLRRSALRRIRGDRISMIFQEPMSSLNPLFTVGEQIAETLRLHRGMNRAQARAAAIDLLKRVRIAEPERRIDDYPHRLSGGMRQRVMIAMAIACQPDLLIADEPTTALDVTVQAQILDILDEMKSQLGLSILLITHDLGVVAERADRIFVMYAGRIVESAAVGDLFADPRHPYTVGLLQSLPRIGAEGKLAFIPGVVPAPSEFPTGCRFRDRCPRAQALCAETSPPLALQSDGHSVACHFA